MKQYLDLFISFFKIGAFTLGGGYVMIPLIEKEVVDKRKWIDNNEFIEMLTLAQSAPGPIAINTAMFVGYKIKGIKGMIATVLGTVIPSFTIILFIAMFFMEFENSKTVERIFCGIRPAVVALIAVPVINMLKNNNFKVYTIIIASCSAVAVWLLSISPVVVIIAAGLCAVMYNTFISKQC
ncbi:MAG: chromate transporter [Prevotellaceae bacterium]|jgi:chromate transporter|nr:chromate transporter [Prevotellaceae bacterium]